MSPRPGSPNANPKTRPPAPIRPAPQLAAVTLLVDKPVHDALRIIAKVNQLTVAQTIETFISEMLRLATLRTSVLSDAPWPDEVA